MHALRQFRQLRRRNLQRHGLHLRRHHLYHDADALYADGQYRTATSDQRGFPIVGTPDIGAYEAGTFTNYNAWIYETLPAAATLDQHDATFDYDGDGQTNGSEWAALTDPASAASSFRITSAVRSGGNLLILFASVTGRTYTLQQSDTLAAGSWSNSPNAAINGNGAVKTFTVPVSIARRFFRVLGGP